MRQRGFGWIQAVIALGALAAVISAAWGAIAWHAGTHFKRGEASMQLKWEEANRKAEEAAKLRANAVAVRLAEADRASLDAQALGEQSNRKWKEATRDAKRKQLALAACEAGPAAHGPVAAPGVRDGSDPAPSPGGGDPARVAAPRLRFTWEFVRQYDSAWTGLGGEPLPEAARWDPGAELAGASPYTAEDVRDVHGENAQACSADRRELAGLISKIEAAAETWDRASR